VNALEKNRLSQEAALQIKALGQIDKWMKIALALSAVGVAFAYTGYTGKIFNLFFGISGIVLILTGTGSAVVFNLGLRNGRRNVEKILNLLEMDKS